MLKWNNFSLKKQLIIIFVIIQILILSVIYFYFTDRQSEFYIEQLKVSLKNEAKLIISKEIINIDANNLNKKTRNRLDKWSKKWGKEIDARITMINKDGKVIADSTYNPEKMDNHLNRPEIQEVIKDSESGSAIRRSDTLKIDMLYMALPVIKNGEIVAFMRLAKSLEEINNVVKENLKNYIIFFLIVLIFSLILLGRFTSDLIKPIQKMSKIAAKIADGNYGESINLKSHSKEIDKMTQQFNLMSKKLEKKINEISEEKNKAEAILSSMVDGVIATDENGEIMLINPAAREMLFIDEKHVRDKDFIQVVRNYKINELLEKVLKENDIISQEILLQREEEKILRCHFASITNEENNIKGGVIVFTDITELRRLEQVRKDFVANVSHELKTPLTSIIGYVDTLLENENINKNTKNKFLKIIKDEADRLGILIQDLLNLSKFEDSNPELNPGNINNLINKTVSILEEKAGKKNISIKTKMAEDSLQVYMIKEQIEQVMINLIDNAIKYTPEDGEIEIKVLEKENKVLVEVIDNGIGIPQKDQQRIFERFYRVDKARSRSMGGTGIGLSIVKHIIKSHDSEINLESESGKGSKFWFYLKKVK
ncbi:MAG TPA: ATP-binding protein [Halanaerobiales bacterium]|nr:ATP-binding protein [Halanaerobiales bacterium]